MGASKFGCLVLWWRNGTIYLDFHKWVLQILDVISASLCCLLSWTQWKRGTLEEEKNYPMIHWNFLGIFTLKLFYTFTLLIFLYVCIYLCLYFHV